MMFMTPMPPTSSEIARCGRGNNKDIAHLVVLAQQLQVDRTSKSFSSGSVILCRSSRIRVTFSMVGRNRGLIDACTMIWSTLSFPPTGSCGCVIRHDRDVVQLAVGTTPADLEVLGADPDRLAERRPAGSRRTALHGLVPITTVRLLVRTSDSVKNVPCRHRPVERGHEVLVEP